MPKPKPSLESRVEYPWILDELEGFPYTLKRFFGCTAIYEDARLLLILHHRKAPQPDDGVWLATQFEHHPSLAKEFPDLRNVEVIGGASSAWRLIPEGSPAFESSVRRACELIRTRDPRIGKFPGAKKPRAAKSPTATARARAAPAATQAPKRTRAITQQSTRKVAQQSTRTAARTGK